MNNAMWRRAQQHYELDYLQPDEDIAAIENLATLVSTRKGLTFQLKTKKLDKAMLLITLLNRICDIYQTTIQGNTVTILPYGRI